MNKRTIVHPNCCPGAARGAVFLGRVYDTVSAEDYTYLKIPPVWCVLAYDAKYRTETPQQVQFCPCCGKSLPEIAKKKVVPKRLIKLTDGYVCHCCGETRGPCNCKDTVEAYEVAR